jgi:hypothetical protein
VYDVHEYYYCIFILARARTHDHDDDGRAWKTIRNAKKKKKNCNICGGEKKKPYVRTTLEIINVITDNARLWATNTAVYYIIHIIIY